MSFKKKKIICIVTARKGSKGIKNKNISKIKGKPLLFYPISNAIKSKYIDRVILSTDSYSYSKIGKKYGAVFNSLRPKRYSRDNSDSVSTVLYEIQNNFKLEKIIYDYVVLLEPTSPLTSYKIIDRCIKKLINHDFAKSLIGVGLVKSQHPLFLVTKKNNMLNYLPFNRSKKFYRRQDTENLYFFDGSIYISDINNLKKSNSFIHSRTLLENMKKINNIEIDDKEDLELIRKII